MKRIAFGLALCLSLAGASFADMWDDTPVSSDWDTPAPAAEKKPKAKPAKKAEPAKPAPQQTAPASDGWDTPATVAAPAPVAEKKPEPKPAVEPAPASDGWDTAPAPVAATDSAAPAKPEQTTTVSDDWGTPTPEAVDSGKPAAKKEADQAAADKATKKMKDEKKPAKSGSGIKIRWVPISICAGVAVVGGVLTAVFDSKASNATSEKPRNAKEYKKGYDDAGSYQTMRAVSIGVMAVGIAGVGLTFLF